MEGRVALGIRRNVSGEKADWAMILLRYMSDFLSISPAPKGGGLRPYGLLFTNKEKQEFTSRVKHGPLLPGTQRVDI